MMSVCSPKTYVKKSVTFTLCQVTLAFEDMLKEVCPEVENGAEEKNDTKKEGQISLCIFGILVYLTVLPLMESLYWIGRDWVKECLDKFIEQWLFRYELGLLCHF